VVFDSQERVGPCGPVRLVEDVVVPVGVEIDPDLV
jgi:hypothetical protein